MCCCLGTLGLGGSALAPHFHRAAREKPQSVWHQVTVESVPAPAPRALGLLLQKRPPCTSLLSACSALSTDTTLLTLQAAPAALLLQGGLCPPWGLGRGRGPAQAGGCCNAEAGAADTAGRAWAAALIPMAQPWLAEPCPQRGGTVQSCCPLSPGCSLQVCLLSQTQHLS